MLFAPKHPAFKEKDVSHGTLKNQFICSKILVLVIFVKALIWVPWDPFVERWNHSSLELLFIFCFCEKHTSNWECSSLNFCFKNKENLCLLGQDCSVQHILCAWGARRRNLCRDLLIVHQKVDFHLVNFQEKKASSVMSIYQKIGSCVLLGGSVAEWFRVLDLKSGGPWFIFSTLLLPIMLMR